MLESAGIAIGTVHSIFIVVNIVGNCLVCAIVKKNRNMRTPVNYLLVNLAVSDILFAVFIAPDVFLRLTTTHPGGVAGTVLCKLLTGGNVAWIAAASSNVTLVAIAIERYYAVVYPLGNKRQLIMRNLKVIVLGSWIFSLIFSVPIFLITNVKGNVCDNMHPHWLIKANRWMWFVLVAISLASMVWFYSRIVCTLWFKGSDVNPLTYQQRGVLRVRKRVTLMVVTVTALFGICWLTDMIVHVVDQNTSYTIDKKVYTVIHTMILISSAVNPFVYALVSQNFKEKLKKVMCCTISRADILPA